MTDLVVPWNAAWSGEARYEIRPCRWAQGALAIWAPHAPGTGRPIFAKPHMVRQRMSIVRFICTVCGKPTQAGDRWWFQLGTFQEGWFMTTEAPVHRVCAEQALELCPHLRRLGCAADLAPFPPRHTVLSSIVGGAEADADFKIRIGDRRVVGHMKFAWPISMVRRVAPAAVAHAQA